jgi:hypothetical protein
MSAYQSVAVKRKRRPSTGGAAESTYRHHISQSMMWAWADAIAAHDAAKIQLRAARARRNAADAEMLAEIGRGSR